MLINGQWARDFDPVQDTDEEGGFVRKESRFRDWITSDGSSDFPAEAGRYHLYVGLICPWACRTLMARRLKGLESVIGISIVNPRLTEKVWRFGGFPGATEDHLHGYDYIYQLYLHADPRYTGEVTIPVLWDSKRETIVNNESSEIIRMLNSGFGELADDSIDLYPVDLRQQIDEVNEKLYGRFNNGVYRVGFATTQVAYDHAVTELFETIDWIEQRLSRQPFLSGDRFTEADLRAFVTMVRFDSAYHGLFKANLRRLADYPAIHDYIQRIHAMPGIAGTVNLEHIKAGYYSIKALNPTGIAPLGPEQPW